MFFIWNVEHPEHETVKVEADTRLNAITTAARLWGVPWTTVARECRANAIEQLEKPKPVLPAKSGKKKPETVKKAKSRKEEHHGD
jgi:hypothetical protein